MKVYQIGQMTLPQLAQFVEIQNQGVVLETWDELAQGQLTQEEELVLSILRKRLVRYRPHLANEATIWAREIYPLLFLAERDDIRAFAEVPLSATLPFGEIRGEVDGVLAREGLDLAAVPPYLVVVEAKRGVEGSDPVAQVLAGLVCAGWRNYQHTGNLSQKLYGCYTIADIWTFLQVTLTGLDTERPRLTVLLSGEYVEKREAATILIMLKNMLDRLLPQQR